MNTPNANPKAMTAFAQAALAASDLISGKFASTKLSGSVARVVKVEGPNTESTGGGKAARESILLKPENGDSSQALTVGFLDVGLRSAELRSHGALSLLYKQRHKKQLDLPRAEYEAFFDQLRNLLEGEGFVVKVVDQQAQAEKANTNTYDENNKASGSGAMVMAIGGLLALIVVGGVAFLLFSK